MKLYRIEQAFFKELKNAYSRLLYQYFQNKIIGQQSTNTCKLNDSLMMTQAVRFWCIKR